MGIEQHLVGLQRVGAQQEGTAVRQLDMRHLKLGALVGQKRDRPVRRAISRTDSFCRKCMRRMMFESPMWITPVTPAPHRLGERFTWLKSQGKLRACPAQFWVEINRHGAEGLSSTQA